MTSARWSSCSNLRRTAALRATDEGLLRERKQMRKKASRRPDAVTASARALPRLGTVDGEAEEGLVRDLHQENDADRPVESQRHRRHAACDRLPEPLTASSSTVCSPSELAGQGGANRDLELLEGQARSRGSSDAPLSLVRPQSPQVLRLLVPDLDALIGVHHRHARADVLQHGLEERVHLIDLAAPRP